jgi:hypothetical protein
MLTISILWRGVPSPCVLENASTERERNGKAQQAKKESTAPALPMQGPAQRAALRCDLSL